MRGRQPSWLDRLRASVEEAALSAWRRRATAVATVAVIGVTLAFPAAGLVGLSWVRSAVRQAARTDEIRAFLLPSATEAQARAVLEASAAATPGEARLVDADAARRAFLARFPELEDAVLALPAEELAFPRSVELQAPADEAAARALVARLAALPGVEEVRHDAGWSGQLGRVRRGLDALASAFATAAFALAAFGVGSVIRIGALSRREELAIMRLVGAPRFHVRAPFVLEGFAQGLLGGLLAAGVVAAFAKAIAPAAAALLPAAREGAPTATLALLVAGSALAGLAGAAIAVEGVLRRHARLER